MYLSCMFPVFPSVSVPSSPYPTSILNSLSPVEHSNNTPLFLLEFPIPNFLNNSVAYSSIDFPSKLFTVTTTICASVFFCNSIFAFIIYFLVSSFKTCE